MKSLLAMFCLTCSVCVAAPLQAQVDDSATTNGRYASYFRAGDSLGYAMFQDDQDDEGSPSDRFGPRANQDPMGSDDDPMDDMAIVDVGCESFFDGCGCEGNGCSQGCRSCQRWKLIQINGCGIEVGGWLSGGVTVADHNVPTTTPVAFVNPTDEVLLNQLWVFAERSADRSSCSLDWGFRIDYVFGADGPDTQAFGDQGWDFGWNSGGTGGNTYGSAIPQAYLEFARNDWGVKLGHFYTIIGYESVASPENFFYSHSYTMNYGEPFTHTGVLADYAAHEHITLFGGYTFGWDSGVENFLDAHTFLGGVDIQLADHVSLSYMLNWGEFGDGTAKNLVASNAGEIYMHSIVAQFDLSCRLKYVVQSDYGTNFGLGSPNNEWYGLNQYMLYSINQCWDAGLRYEVFRDHAGTSGRVTNNAETYHAWTMGVNWKPTSNVIVRPEARFDYVDNSTGPFSGQNSLVTFGVDAIFRF